MTTRVWLTRVRLNSGGYSSRGVYFGLGPAVWRYSGEDGIGDYLRARDREAAKAAIQKLIPDAVFFR